MPSVLFVAPFFLETTLRFVEATADLPGVRLGLITQEPPERLPERLAGKLAAFRRIEDCFDPGQLVAAAGGLVERVGRAERMFGALEQLQVPLAEARERLGIEGMPLEVAKSFRDKSRMKTQLAAAGLPCARHRLAGEPAAAWAFAGEVGYPLVLKPPAGAGAQGTFRVDGPEALGEALATLAPTPQRPALVEEFMIGEEQSFDTISIAGRPVWHSLTHYLPTPLEVLRNPWIQWCVLLPREVDDPRYDDIREAAYRALAVLGMGTGMSHMEWFRRPDGSVAISEVAARPPGAQITSLISYAHELDVWSAWARLMVFGLFEPPRRRYAAGAAFLRGQGRGRVVAVHGLDQAQRELGHLVMEARLPQPGQAKAGSYEGEGFVLLRHPETAVVARALHRLISLLRVELG